MGLRRRIIKLTEADKKRLGIKKFNYVLETNEGWKGFRTLGQLNRYLGLSGKTAYKVSSFK